MAELGHADEVEALEEAARTSVPVATGVAKPTPSGEGPQARAAGRVAKPVAGRSEGAAPGPGSATAAPRRRRKVREGIVASNAKDKTAVIVVVERVRHPRYAKTVQRTKRLYAHDDANDVKVGDRVRLSETRPLSRLKRWRIEQVLERAR